MSGMVNSMPENQTSEVHPLAFEKIISFKDPRVLWEENWFAVVLEVTSALVLLYILQRAKKKGVESFYLVLAAISCAFCLETLPILPRPGYQLWWYHQGIVNFLHQRVPSFVISSFAIVHYVAHSLTERSNLPVLSKSFVTATFATLLYLPSVWLSPRLLLLLLHFDDPLFKDRLLDVPYVQVLVVFLLFFHASHLFKENFDAIETEDRNGYNYLLCSLQSGLVSAVYTIVEEFLLYLWFALTLKGNSGLGLLAAIAITAFLSKQELESCKMKGYTVAGFFQPMRNKVFWAAFGILLMVTSVPLWLDTSNLRSNGSRLELGQCHVTHSVANTSPLEIIRRRYICPEDKKHLAFDFSCVDASDLQQAVRSNDDQYTVCGKPFIAPETIARSMGIYSMGCLFVIYNFLRLSLQFDSDQASLKAGKTL